MISNIANRHLPRIARIRTNLQHLLAALILAIACLTPATAQWYLPTDIVAPAGGAFRPDAVNDFGQVCGGYTPPGGLEQPAVWQSGVVTQLPLLPGTVSGWARELNNNGQIVGGCTAQDYRPRACIWESGRVRELPFVAGTNYSAAWAINDAGTVVGHVYTDLFDALGNFTGAKREAVIWKGNVAAKLTPPVAGAWTWAKAIDNSGRVALVWWEGDGNGSGNIARWTPDVPNGTTGTMMSLNAYGEVMDINNAGVICGTGPMIWDGSEGFMLPMPLNNAYYGTATGINDAEEVVGSAEGPDWYYTAFVWSYQYGMRDLNTLLAATSPYAYPGTFYSAQAINNAGQILAQANSGYVLLTPSDQPPGPLLPQPPTWVGATAGASAGTSMVRVSWNGAYTGWLDGTPAWSYKVKRSTVSGGPYTTIATVAADGVFEDTSVVNGTTYYYVVSATDGVNESAHSMEASATPVAPPVAPTALKATEFNYFSTKGIKLSWKQSLNPGIRWNRVYRSTNGGNFMRIAEIDAGTSYQDIPIARKVIYSYKLTAVNSNGQESPFSTTATVRTK